MSGVEAAGAGAEHKAAVWAELLRLYNDGSEYEGLSQLDHALQAAHQAVQFGADNATVVAALLHDVGWKLAGAAPLKIDNAAKSEGVDIANDNDLQGCCAPDAGCRAADLGILTMCGMDEGASPDQMRAQHDLIGATFLRMRGFDEKVAHLVEGHVLAKRYLCTVDEGYHDRLSPGSVMTLKFQGGVMSAAEVRLFEADPLLDLCKTMRTWDEEAKITGLEVPDFNTYYDMVMECITGGPKSAKETLAVATFIRNGNEIVALNSPASAPSQPVPACT